MGQRTLFPALVDELEPEAILHYRRELLTAIREQGVHSRQEIHWGHLESRFRPKTKAMLQKTFHNLTKGGRESYAIKSAEEFDMRVSEALDKIERQLSLPEEKMRTEFSSQGWKQKLRDKFEAFIAKM